MEDLSSRIILFLCFAERINFALESSVSYPSSSSILTEAELKGKFPISPSFVKFSSD